ncbi:MAG: ADP-ribosylglycohydrolase family protein [bacterium]|jgi:ADP-ribosyl-[dinitrogen reductase] hydrolase
MLGAIAGDVIGSVYEFDNYRNMDFPLFREDSTFTDDTVMTIAVADCILKGSDYVTEFKNYGRKYPNRGYGGQFGVWLRSEDRKPYNSWGNGSAMRVSPVGFAFATLEETLQEARRSAEVTHNHPEGIKGAQATAAAIFWARMGKSKEDIRELTEQYFSYNLNFTLDEIRPTYPFDESCQGTVPVSIAAFLESENFEDAIRRAISVGGDSDTIACITGGIAQAYYEEIPEEIMVEVQKRLPPELMEVVEEFCTTYVFG